MARKLTQKQKNNLEILALVIAGIVTIAASCWYLKRDTREVYPTSVTSVKG